MLRSGRGPCCRTMSFSQSIGCQSAYRNSSAIFRPKFDDCIDEKDGYEPAVDLETPQTQDFISSILATIGRINLEAHSQDSTGETCIRQSSCMCINSLNISFYSE